MSNRGKSLATFTNKFFYLELNYQPRDIWIGLYLSKHNAKSQHFEFYLCILPLLPLRIIIYNNK